MLSLYFVCACQSLVLSDVIAASMQPNNASVTLYASTTRAAALIMRHSVTISVRVESLFHLSFHSYFMKELFILVKSFEWTKHYSIIVVYPQLVETLSRLSLRMKRTVQTWHLYLVLRTLIQRPCLHLLTNIQLYSLQLHQPRTLTLRCAVAGRLIPSCNSKMAHSMPSGVSGPNQIITLAYKTKNLHTVFLDF